MVEERFEDLRGDPQHISFYGWRCVCCGNVADPVILHNRSNQAVAAFNVQLHRTQLAEAAKTWNFDFEAA
jgi:hypothetical protein